MSALPTGCTDSDFPGPNISIKTAGAGFTGCVVGVASVLLTCCARVGGTAAFAHDTCGCPFDATFTGDAEESFGDCALESNETSTCFLNAGPAAGASAAGAAVKLTGGRVNAAVVVLGIALVLGVMGA
ncbi:hypothetical protein B0H17DRAFT_1210031 [Mycena rosella]|uniref:Uncharacterized protein n=1 Tax=Mycena rosella TaxID=1033263 RepID=A0AAD7G8X2_MYCRO|nr:hypothetical protein B0H17DRAFT_1210031 [Mycena rosella]